MFPKLYFNFEQLSVSVSVVSIRGMKSFIQAQVKCILTKSLRKNLYLFSVSFLKWMKTTNKFTKVKEEPHSLGYVPPLLRALARHPRAGSSTHPLLIS